MNPLDPSESIRMALESERIKDMKVDSYFAELLTLVREIHAMLKEQTK